VLDKPGVKKLEALVEVTHKKEKSGVLANGRAGDKESLDAIKRGGGGKSFIRRGGDNFLQVTRGGCGGVRIELCRGDQDPVGAGKRMLSFVRGRKQKERRTRKSNAYVES